MKNVLYVLCMCLFWGCGGQVEKPAPPIDTADQVFPREGDFAASHILVAYQGAEGADETVTRSKEEAMQEADKLLGMVLAEPNNFASLAREHSNGPSSEAGGVLGAWKQGEFVSEFEQAVENMLVGEILKEPLESDFGFHIIRRDDLAVMHYSASGFVISFKGHPENPPTVHRTREEAEALANSLKDKVTAENFEEMALEYNDLGEGSRSMGVVRPGDPWPEAAFSLLDDLAYGQVGGPVAFPMGYVFLRREKVVRYAGSVILVAFDGAERARRSITRTQAEAEERAKSLIIQLQEDPSKFEELAENESDSPMATKKGSMGTIFRGNMDKAFREAFEALEEGSFTQAPVATRYGYYIIRREPINS